MWYAGPSASVTTLTPPSQAFYDRTAAVVPHVRTLTLRTPNGQDAIEAPVLKAPARPSDMQGDFPALPSPYMHFPSNPLFCEDPDAADPVCATPPVASHPVADVATSPDRSGAEPSGNEHGGAAQDCAADTSSNGPPIAGKLQAARTSASSSLDSTVSLASRIPRGPTAKRTPCSVAPTPAPSHADSTSAQLGGGMLLCCGEVSACQCLTFLHCVL